MQRGKGRKEAGRGGASEVAGFVRQEDAPAVAAGAATAAGVPGQHGPAHRPGSRAAGG